MAGVIPKTAKPTAKPTASQTGKLRAELARIGVPPAVANEAVKMSKTRAEIAGDLIQYLRGRR